MSVRSPTPPNYRRERPTPGTEAPREQPKLLQITDGHLVVYGAVFVFPTSTLGDVRRLMEEEDIRIPETTSFQFLYGGAPVTRVQEARRRAFDVLPKATVMAEGPVVIRAPGTTSPPHADVPSSSSRASPEAAAAAAPRPTVPRAAAPSRPVDEHGGEETEREPVSPGEVAEAEGSALLPSTAAQGGSVLRLDILEGPLEGESLRVSGHDSPDSRVVIGRHTSNTIAVPEAGISRFHCEINFVDDLWMLKDLGSTTGTFFYLRSRHRFKMFTGLMVKMGESEFMVVNVADSEMRLLFSEGPHTGKQVKVTQAGLSIGRRSTNRLVLTADDTVSAHHGKIQYDVRRQWWFLIDLGSSNGTCCRISPEREQSAWHQLQHGDVIGAGCTKLRVSLCPG